MRWRAPDTPHGGRPREPFRLAPIVWFLTCAGFASSLAIASAGFVSMLETSDAREFTGELRPGGQSLGLDLPAGVYLDEILVEPGEEVRAAQTLATFDARALRQDLNEVEREIATRKDLLDCLLGRGRHAAAATSTDGPATGPDLSGAPETETDASPPLDALAAAERDVARHDCAAFHEKRIANISAVADRRLVLLERRNLTEKYLALSKTREARADGASPLNQARLTVGLLLTRNTLDEQIAELHIEMRQIKLAADEELKARSTEVVREIAEFSEKQFALRRLVDEPRLSAPEAGVVLRVRAAPRGVKLATASQIIELAPLGAVSFQAEFSVSSAEADAVRLGSHVKLRVFGAQGRGPLLEGEVTRLKADDGAISNGRVTAEVSLDEASILRLADPKSGIALNNQGSASSIRVTVAGARLSTALGQSIERSAPKARHSLMDFPKLITSAGRFADE